MDDKYGTVLREQMKQSMKEPFRPKNHGHYCGCPLCQERHDRIYKRSSWIVGVLAGLCILATVAAQILRMKGTQ